MTPVWGIDLGGTKIEGAVLESRDSINPIARIRVPTEQEKGYTHIQNQIALLIEKMSAETGLQPTSIGIATPGTIDPITQLMKNSNTVCLNNQPFYKDLQAKLDLPLYMANDANCFAVAEANLGVVPEKMPDATVVFGVIMGTGVGGGLVVDGRGINGRQGIGGEWGHIFLDESGGQCYCGKVGCVEKVISGPALESYYKSLTGEHKKLKSIVSDHLAGEDSAATKTVERLLAFFGKAISYVINIVDPDVIVLGGGLGNIPLLYTLGIEAVEKHVFNNRLDTVFLKPKLGDSAGVFGAALLVPEN